MFSSIAVKGDGMGSILGFPTANFDLTKSEVGLEAGIYASKVTMDGADYIGALCVHKEIEKIEVHLLDFDGGELYGKELTVEPHKKVSEFTDFTTLQALKEKIQSDVDAARSFFE